MVIGETIGWTFHCGRTSEDTITLAGVHCRADDAMAVTKCAALERRGMRTPEISQKNHSDGGGGVTPFRRPCLQRNQIHARLSRTAGSGLVGGVAGALMVLGATAFTAVRPLKLLATTWLD